MRREFEKYLAQWRSSPNRKPLLLGGVRQCGKTYLLKAFGDKHYRQVVYLNLEREKVFLDLFSNTLKPKEILRQIHLAFPQYNPKEPDTLYIFDEIQAIPKAVTSLKYFAEEMPQVHIAAAGSLLGVALRRNGFSFPVGKVDQQILYPMSFLEFLVAKGYEGLAAELCEPEKALVVAKMREMSSLVISQLEAALGEFMMVGGMPEAVKVWLQTSDMFEVDKIHQQMIQGYQADFAKHAPVSDIPKLNAIWQAIPAQIAKENQKFVFGHVAKGKRAADLADALQWLEDSGLAYKVFQVTEPKIPLPDAIDPAKFKLFSCDIGLLRAQAGLPPVPLKEVADRKTSFYGAIGESFVFTELLKAGYYPCYWRSGVKAELDFVVQSGRAVVPIEVKTAGNKKAKSLATYISGYQPKQALKIWGRGFGISEGGVVSVSAAIKESSAEDGEVSTLAAKAQKGISRGTEIISLPHYFIPALKSLL